jgi:sodium/potassium-transporting ATPase subunit alpha
LTCGSTRRRSPASPDHAAEAPIVAGEAKAVVFATGPRNEFGRDRPPGAKPPARRSLFMREIARVSHIVAVLPVVLGGVFFLIGIRVGLPLWQSLLFAGIIVANVPERLLPTVTLSLALGAQRTAHARC